MLADPTVRPDCGAPPDLTRLDGALDRTALRLTAGDPIKIVAIGSSSTAGAGASSAATTYPARLSVELNRLMPRNSIAVLNRGINGQEVGEMLARLPDDVIREAPDLILWQVGTNAVLRNHPLRPRALLLRKGLRQLKTVQADVVLIDPQFAPKVLAMPEIDEMIDLIATTAQREHVGLFPSFCNNAPLAPSRRNPIRYVFICRSAAYERLELWLHRQAAGELNRKFRQPFDLDQSPLRTARSSSNDR